MTTVLTTLNDLVAVCCFTTTFDFNFWIDRVRYIHCDFETSFSHATPNIVYNWFYDDDSDDVKKSSYLITAFKYNLYCNNIKCGLQLWEFWQSQLQLKWPSAQCSWEGGWQNVVFKFGNFYFSIGRTNKFETLPNSS